MAAQRLDGLADVAGGVVARPRADSMGGEKPVPHAGRGKDGPLVAFLDVPEHAADKRGEGVLLGIRIWLGTCGHWVGAACKHNSGRNKGAPSFERAGRLTAHRGPTSNEVRAQDRQNCDDEGRAITTHVVEYVDPLEVRPCFRSNLERLKTRD